MNQWTLIPHTSTLWLNCVIPLAGYIVGTKSLSFLLPFCCHLDNYVSTQEFLTQSGVTTYPCQISSPGGQIWRPKSLYKGEPPSGRIWRPKSLKVSLQVVESGKSSNLQTFVLLPPTSQLKHTFPTCSVSVATAKSSFPDFSGFNVQTETSSSGDLTLTKKVAKLRASLPL